MYLLTHIFGGGMWGGWGGWGYGVPYGGPVIVNNDYYGGGGYGGEGGYGNASAPEPEVEHAGGFDLFGQQDYDDTSADTGWASDGGSVDSGDFGGGDFGGDFGGGDFGGGGGDL